MESKAQELKNLKIRPDRYVQVGERSGLDRI